MKTTLFSGILLLTLSSGLNAQNTFNCTSQDHYERLMQTDPVFKRNQEQLEMETRAYINSPARQKAASATYIIPVVFHVIYSTAYGNVSDAQIIDQVAILNKEFKRLQADTALTPVPFKPFAAPFDVEFRLATIDPNGKCTNGINRVYSTLTNCSVQENDVKSVSYWPSNKYLNIWLTQAMHYSGNTTCDGGGYAQFPGGAATTDGVNIRGDLIGNIGTAATNQGWGNFKGRYLIHELGHWFNLRHIWGDANCGDDQVGDTPPAVFSNSGCPSFPHNAFNSCGSGVNGEMFTDYMDYTNGPCLNMFTAGQVARMTAAINSPVSGRSNLWTNANLNATGTNNPYTYPVACTAVPDVLQNGAIVVCLGDSAKLTDNSYGGLSTSRSWDFGGQATSSLTDSIVKVKYNAPGVYSFTLTKTYNGNSKSTVFQKKIYVLDNAPDPNFVLPFEESFEDSADFRNKWTVVNQDNDAVTWEVNNTTAYNGSNCIGIANFNNAAPTIDEVISPAYDLSAVENPTLTFKLSFAGRTTVNNDQLQVFISNSCGKTWSSIYIKSATGALKTQSSNVATSYTPSPTSAEWREEKVNIFPQLATGKVRFRFVFTGGGGNNIFLDDVNIDGFSTVGLGKVSLAPSVRIFPNPANDHLTVRYDLKDNTLVELELTDVLGKKCSAVNPVVLQAKDNAVTLDTKALDAGVYFINLRANGSVIRAGKFVKQASE